MIKTKKNLLNHTKKKGKKMTKRRLVEIIIDQYLEQCGLSEEEVMRGRYEGHMYVIEVLRKSHYISQKHVEMLLDGKHYLQAYVAQGSGRYKHWINIERHGRIVGGRKTVATLDSWDF